MDVLTPLTHMNRVKRYHTNVIQKKKTNKKNIKFPIRTQQFDDIHYNSVRASMF